MSRALLRFCTPILAQCRAHPSTPIIMSCRAISFTPSLEKGHSKWQNIKEGKAKIDSERSRKITIMLAKAKSAARRGGFDLKLNRELEDICNQYKAQGLPSDTLQNALLKFKNSPDVSVEYSLIGPSGSFFIIIVEAESSQASKARGRINKLMSKIGGFRSVENLRNKFNEKETVVISCVREDGTPVTLEEVEEVGINLDCEEVNQIEEDDVEKFELQFDIGKGNAAENKLKEQGFIIDLWESRLIPQFRVTVPPSDMETVESFYTALKEVEEVKNIFDNIEYDEE